MTAKVQASALTPFPLPRCAMCEQLIEGPYTHKPRFALDGSDGFVILHDDRDDEDGCWHRWPYEGEQP